MSNGGDPRSTTSQRIAGLRQDYDRSTLRRTDLAADPLEQLGRWLDDAIAAEVDEPGAMILATADGAGAPSARTVLLRGLDGDGLRFFTNYESRKGRELAANPRAALCFLWLSLHRQARVEGRVEMLEPAASDAYFASRPQASQLGAWSSPQSTVIENRAALEARVATTSARFAAGDAVPRPPFWGGYRLIPDLIELWQGRPSRLHDRFRYRRAATKAGSEQPAPWIIERLAP